MIAGQVTWDHNQFTADLQQLWVLKNGSIELGRATVIIGNDGVTPVGVSIERVLCALVSVPIRVIGAAMRVMLPRAEGAKVPPS